MIKNLTRFFIDNIDEITKLYTFLTELSGQFNKIAVGLKF
jgi:hypothetical protein